MFGLNIWVLVAGMALSTGAVAYVNHLRTTNTELKADVAKHEKDANNYNLAIDALQTEIRYRADEARKFQEESAKRAETVRVVTRKLDAVLKNNSHWSDPDLPSDVNDFLCDIEAKTAAGSDPSICPAGETNTNPGPEAGRQEPRRNAEGVNEFHASTRRMQRGQGGDSGVYYSTTEPATGEYQRINHALIARNREGVR